jgi:hypothetical protein
MVGEQEYSLIYQACLQGPKIIDALPLTEHHGGTIFQLVLRTPVSRLDAEKVEVVQTMLARGFNRTGSSLLRARLGDIAFHTVAGDNQATMPEEENY